MNSAEVKELLGIEINFTNKLNEVTRRVHIDFFEKNGIKKRNNKEILKNRLLISSKMIELDKFEKAYMNFLNNYFLSNANDLIAEQSTNEISFNFLNNNLENNLDNTYRMNEEEIEEIKEISEELKALNFQEKVNNSIVENNIKLSSFMMKSHSAKENENSAYSSQSFLTNIRGNTNIKNARVNIIEQSSEIPKNRLYKANSNPINNKDEKARICVDCNIEFTFKKNEEYKTRCLTCYLSLVGKRKK